jgi:hypothetical protein
MGNSTVSLQSGYNNYPDNPLMSKDNISTYFGVISTDEEKLNLIYMRNRMKKQMNEEHKNSQRNTDYKVPTMFEWSSKGNSVYLTGSFCNWKQFFLMKKDENGIFRLILDLNRGFHQYKFVIDNEWKYNTNFPTINDHGFINNYIDTSKCEIIGEFENEELNNSLFSPSDIDLISFAKEKEINLSLSDEFYKATISYGNYLPLKNEMCNTSPQYPYQIIFECINQDVKINHNNLSKTDKDNKYDNKYDNKLIYYKNFMHEQINHFHLKIITEGAPLRSSMISRNRFKFTTFIYYK